jgi:GMP synthase (glutamine-hydrolysing)
MKRALVIRHVPFEGLSGLAAPIADAGYRAEALTVGDVGFDDADFLSPDLLVVMGGPMGVYEQAKHPWIAGEIARIAGRIAQHRPTLGICLGAQMIAAALGGTVAPGPAREVGFAPIGVEDAGMASPIAALAGVPLLHWHGDGFTLPDGATLLARTATYPQAFSLGPAILALQCHPEMGFAGDGLEKWLEGSDAYLESAGTSVDRLRAEHRALGVAAAIAGRSAIAAWLAELPSA